MRKMTARQRQVISLLVSSEGEMTAAEIAGSVGVSVRTVHREMEEIERILQSFGLLLSRKSGKGIQLGGPAEGIEELRRFLREAKPAEYSGEERKVMELCRLLEAEEPVKLFALSHSLKVTAATISYDLDELEPWLRKFSLRLIRRRGYGVEIEGSEFDKRRALSRLAAEHLDQSDLVGYGVHTESNPMFAKLLTAVGQDRLIEIENTFWDMEWGWTLELPEIVYMELLIGLAIAVRRVEIGRGIDSVDSAGYSRKSEHRNIPGAEQFIARLEEELKIRFPKAEILHIAGLFDRAQDSFSSADSAYGDIGLMELVYRLTENVIRRTGLPFQSDRTLREGLLEHMEPALRRIREGTRIRNPLLNPIRRDYEELFQIIRLSVEELELDLSIPDEEIGFLVMHFGASLERLNQLKRKVRAILVCSSGLSSSRLLAIRLSKELPQIEILGNASWYEAARMPESEYDLIISTIDLPLPRDRYIRISPLLTPEETVRLLDYIQNTTLREQPGGAAGENGGASPADRALERLLSYKGLLDEIIGLMERFRYHPLDNTGLPLAVMLRSMLDQLEAGIIDDNDLMVERLLERERLGSQVIPDTGLALFHARSSHVRESSLTLYRLRSPVMLEGEQEVSVILLMLAPRKLAKESLEVLSEISSMLLNTELVELLQEKTEEEIRAFLSAELLRFFENKR
ncbi:BglG family transcription antiterminator [Paenibacillus tengchongensis]|uniref:BglG family transcription antiterminator n=1 Tax=Paenibacillus tengchongensis TaxID=2608684 RepID=UPI00124C25FF|nr:BglG family transcription antiterminator [Paenibacillus tengchongensis]